MKSKRKIKPVARVAARKAKGNRTAESPRSRAAAGKRKPRGARSKSLPPRTQPAYEELLRFFNESVDLLCLAGFDGKFKRLNPAWEATLGWTAAELTSRPFLDFVHFDDRPATATELRKLIFGRPTIEFENRYLCKDGSCKWLQWTARPLPGREAIYAIAREVTRQKQLEEEILQILDGERERVGSELHDGLCQEMAGIAALSDALARKLAPVAAAESAAAREIGKLLSRSIEHARDLARGFIPLHHKAIGLVPALSDFCANTEALFRIKCRFHCQAEPPPLDTKQKSQLYRIVQEAVNNAIAHGRARRVEISLAFHAGRGVLTIQDNGVGIGPAQEGNHGVGLRTMAYRARLIGASFEVKRGSPRGTVVSCGFSLPGVQPARDP